MSRINVVKSNESDMQAGLYQLKQKVDIMLEQNRLILEQNDLILKAIAHLRGEVNIPFKKLGAR